MKNRVKGWSLSVVIAITLFVPLTNAKAYTIEKNLIGNGAPAGYTSSNKYVILHEAGNPSNTGADSLDREVNYMRNNWTSAFVSYFVGSGGRVVQLANNGAYQYGAGQVANSYGYAQIELARTNNQATFEKDYKSYINLARDLAKQAGVPLTLDSYGNGIKTHLWVSNNIWGDHQDPYAYLASWGITKAQLAQDLLSGFTIPATPDVEKEIAKPGTNTPVPTKSNQMIYRADDLQYIHGLWQVKSNYLVPTDFNWYQNGIAVGDITLVDKDGNVLADQVTKPGSYFIVDQDKATVITKAAIGSGNYYWSLTKTSTGGNVWLSVWNQSHLIYGK